MKECYTSSDIQCEYYSRWMSGEFTCDEACSNKQAHKAWALYRERMLINQLITSSKLPCSQYVEVNYAKLRERAKVKEEEALEIARGSWTAYYENHQWWESYEIPNDHSRKQRKRRRK